MTQNPYLLHRETLERELRRGHVVVCSFSDDDATREAPPSYSTGMHPHRSLLVSLPFASVSSVDITNYFRRGSPSTRRVLLRKEPSCEYTCPCRHSSLSLFFLCLVVAGQRRVGSEGIILLATGHGPPLSLAIVDYTNQSNLPKVIGRFSSHPLRYGPWYPPPLLFVDLMMTWA